ncbi:MAG: DUF4266 domain-containing protein [Deltaproteobacteria bacterium]|nr:DUF4266 domain-containing protein [Deltaproteobacteria bacterium]
MSDARWILIALTFLGALEGCVLVHPWERGALADRRMQVSPRPRHDGCHGHFLTPREGTRPSQDGGGGGCGCD